MFDSWDILDDDDDIWSYTNAPVSDPGFILVLYVIPNKAILGGVFAGSMNEAAWSLGDVEMPKNVCG